MTDNEKLELLKECEHNVIVSDLIETVRELYAQFENPKIKFDYIREYLEDKDKLIWRKRFNDIRTVSIEKSDIDEFNLILGENTKNIFWKFLNLNNSYCRFLKENLIFVQSGDYYLIRSKAELNKCNRYRFLEEDVFIQLEDFIEKKLNKSNKENIVQIWYKKNNKIKCVKNNYPYLELCNIVCTTTLEI